MLEFFQVTKNKNENFFVALYWSKKNKQHQLFRRHRYAIICWNLLLKSLLQGDYNQLKHLTILAYLIIVLSPFEIIFGKFRKIGDDKNDYITWTSRNCSCTLRQAQKFQRLDVLQFFFFPMQPALVCDFRLHLLVGWRKGQRNGR